VDLAPARPRAALSPGAALKALRELQGMTQNELAAASSLDQSVISAMEHERTAIGADRARKLARALRVHPAVIVFPDWDDDAGGASEGVEKAPVARRQSREHTRRPHRRATVA
jgi:transcriptional regulator with XRE-family HTH domain